MLKTSYRETFAFIQFPVWWYCAHMNFPWEKKSVSKSVGNCDRKKDYKVLVSVIIYGIHGDDDNDDLGHTN